MLAAGTKMKEDGCLGGALRRAESLGGQVSLPSEQTLLPAPSTLSSSVSVEKTQWSKH